MWQPPVLKTVANSGEGIEAVIAQLERHRAFLAESGELERRERERVTTELDHLLRAVLLQRLLERVPTEALQEVVSRVLAREQAPHEAVEYLVETYCA